MNELSLLKDEKLIIKTMIHWKNYLLSGLVFLVSLIIFCVRIINPSSCLLETMAPEGTVTSQTALILSKAEMILCAFLAIFLADRLIKVAFIRYYVTNKRIVKSTGLFTVTYSEMLISRCETVKMKQNVIEGLFGCADIICLAPGSQILLLDVTRAEEFKNAILQQISQRECKQE